MKKLLSLLLIAVLCLSLCACGGSKEKGVVINVTVSDAGVLRVANEAVTVPDPDGDGTVTADAVIAAAHDAFYEGGAEAGFIFEETDFGMSIIKLWGVDNGGSYGYYVNDAYVLPDYKLAEGDYLCVYSYADLAGWSDCYSFFDQRKAEAAVGTELKLNLSKLVYDENWELQTVLAEGARLIINGEMTDFATDAQGNVSVKFDQAGSYTVSAIGAEGETLVPPVCIVTVK